ncbi:MAG: hypothetical protein M3N24_10110 [Actinomycetota bacterium]|nr:hypothetical protein [Actinomycetota bacterium]
MRIATYEITNGTFQDIAETAKTELLPKFQDQPGFIRYGVADLGDKKLMSISLWETRDQAHAATPVAATWVKEHVADRVELRSNSVGDLAFFKGVREDVPATV